MSATTTEAPWPAIRRIDEPEVPDFQTEVLPPWLAEWVRQQARAVQVPESLMATPALGVVAGAIAKVAEIVVRPGHVETPNLYMIEVHGPGNRKSEALKRATAPVYARERELEAEMAPRARAAEVELGILRRRYQAAEAEAVKAKTDADRLLASELAKQLRETIERESLLAPRPPRLIVDDATVEKLGVLLQENHERMIVISPEGGELVEMIAGRATAHGGANMGLHLCSHSGDPYTQDRIRRDPVRLRQPLLTIVATMQPVVLARFTPEMRGRGLVARFLFSMPHSLVGHREIEPEPIEPGLAELYDRRVRMLLDLGLRIGEDRRPIVHPVRLHRDALAAWLDFAREVEGQLGEFCKLEHARDWGAKLAGATARLAGVLHFAEWIGEGRDPRSLEIERASMEGAIALGRYFTSHTLAAFGAMGEQPGPRLAQRLVRWIRRRREMAFTRQAAWQQCKGGCTTEELDAALKLLGDHNYVRRASERPEVWSINPQILGNGHALESDGIGDLGAESEAAAHAF